MLLNSEYMNPDELQAAAFFQSISAYRRVSNYRYILQVKLILDS